MRNATTLIVCLTLLACAVSNALAGSRVVLEPRAPAAYVGQPVILKFHLLDAPRAKTAPQLEIDGCDVHYAGIQKSTNTSMVNGEWVVEESATYQYSVIPREEGRFTIPSVAFELASGETLRSEASAIVAANAPRSPDFDLRISVGEEEAFVGQPIPITWEWCTSRAVERIELEWDAPDGADVVPGRQSDPSQNRGTAAFRMMGTDVVLSRSQRRMDDRMWDVYTAEIILVPTRAGTLRIPDASMLIEADTGRRRRGISVFDQQKITELYSDSTPGATIRVLDLPVQGRPSGFSGLFGSYRVEANASPTDVRVGDPIDLTVSVYGPEYATRAPDLNLADAPGFAGVFRVDETDDSVSLTRGSMQIRHTLRAQTDKIDSIPPIEIPYFDPELGRYAVARSSPIPINVAPTRVVTLADAQSGSGDDVTGAALESRTGGLRANVADDSALVSQRFDALAVLRSPIGIAATLAPPGVFVLAGVVAIARKRRTSTADLRASRQALPAALAELRRATTTDEIASAVRAYLTARLPESGASITPGEVVRLLGDANPATRDIASVLEECDAARFGGSHADVADLSARAQSALSSLEKGGR